MTKNKKISTTVSASDYETIHAYAKENNVAVSIVCRNALFEKIGLEIESETATKTTQTVTHKEQNKAETEQEHLEKIVKNIISTEVISLEHKYKAIEETSKNMNKKLSLICSSLSILTKIEKTLNSLELLIPSFDKQKNELENPNKDVLEKLKNLNAILQKVFENNKQTKESKNDKTDIDFRFQQLQSSIMMLKNQIDRQMKNLPDQILSEIEKKRNARTAEIVEKLMAGGNATRTGKSKKGKSVVEKMDDFEDDGLPGKIDADIDWK